MGEAEYYKSLLNLISISRRLRSIIKRQLEESYIKSKSSEFFNWEKFMEAIFYASKEKDCSGVLTKGNNYGIIGHIKEKENKAMDKSKADILIEKKLNGMGGINTRVKVGDGASIKDILNAFKTFSNLKYEDNLGKHTNIYFDKGVWNIDVEKGGDTVHNEYESLEELYENHSKELYWNIEEKDGVVGIPDVCYDINDMTWYIDELEFESDDMDYTARELLKHMNPKISSVKGYENIYESTVEYLQTIKAQKNAEDNLFELINSEGDFE